MGNEKNRNAYAGMNIESLFKNSIGDNPKVIETIRGIFKIEGRYLESIKSGIHGEKADVKMEFACGHNIDVNIKGYKSGFNQLTRTTVKKFGEMFDLSEDDIQELENIVVEKSKNSRNALFPENKQDKWRSFFCKNAKKILRWGFSYKQNREILVLFDRETNIFRIYQMKEVLSRLDTDIQMTKGGVNIGNCVSFQRKGGNGSLCKNIPKYSISHPGNNLQLKLKIHKFIESYNSLLIAQYKV